MKQKTNDGFTAAEIEAARVLQSTRKNLTFAAAKKLYRKIQKEKEDGDATADNIPLSGVPSDSRLVKRQEFLAAADDSARILAQGIREEFRPLYEKFENFVRRYETYFDNVQAFFRKHARDGSELLLGEYNSLEEYLHKACGITERQYHRVRHLIEDGEKTDGKKKPEKKQPEKIEANSSTASEADIINGEVDEDNGEETPVTSQGPSLPALPPPQEEETPTPQEDKKREANHLECKRRETALMHKLQVANRAACDANKEVCDTSELADKLRDLLEKILKLSQKSSNLIHPEELRDYLLDYLPRQLRAFDETHGTATPQSKSVAA